MCEIVLSASPDLDAATCRAMLARARFMPARGDEGLPITSTYESKVRWSVPQDPPVPFAPARRFVES